jgi:hypothetical protein
MAAAQNAPSSVHDFTRAGRDPIGQHQRNGNFSHFGNATGQGLYGSDPGRGGLYFQGQPAFANAGYGATLLPYTMPEGTYQNQANYPLQLSVLPTALRNHPPCYDARVWVGTQEIGSATGEACNSLVSTFVVTIPPGAPFTLSHATARVTALITGGAWGNTGIRFETERRIVDASGCQYQTWTGTRTVDTQNNWLQEQRIQEPCPTTPLSPDMPPGYIPQATLGAAVVLVMDAYAYSHNDQCSVTVFNRSTQQNLYNTGTFNCTSTSLHRVIVPPNTSFSVYGALTAVTVLNQANATWMDTNIYFPLIFTASPMDSVLVGPCQRDSNNTYTQAMRLLYPSNRTDPPTYLDTRVQNIPCTP